MAVCRLTGGEAQTAAGVRSRAFLPKTARRAPQALEAGAFWVHQPKSLSVRSFSVLLRRVACRKDTPRPAQFSPEKPAVLVLLAEKLKKDLPTGQKTNTL